MSKVDELLKDYHEFLGDIDFSEVRTKTTKRLASIVGLKLIDKAIQKNLKEYTDQFFFEYSLLPSSINPSTGRLLSFAGVRMVDPVFEQKVGKYVSKIINTLYPSSTKRVKDYSDGQKVDLLATNWFHNPELFLFPTINNVKPHYIHGSISWPESDNAYLARIEGNTQSIFTSTDEVNLYFANLSYPRSIEEMLEASKTIIKSESKKGGKYPRQKLIKAYHDGARRLKAHYDRYFVNDAGGQYDFITFPILSTRNKVVNNYYCEFYRESLADDSDKHVAGMGHFFLYFRNTRKKALPPSVLVDLFLEINKVISHVALNYVYGTGITMLKNMRKVAVNAAIAQVMARNMSHNFGSHVLSNLTGDKTYRMVRDREMKPSAKMEPSAVNKGYNSFKGDSQSKAVFRKTSEYDRQLPAFFQYLKSRMDYLNEVTFSVTTLVTTRLVREDVMKDLDRVRILLNTISGVGNFRYSFRLLHNNEIIRKRNDIRAAFPADLLGCQAFFNIIENIIRNTAKHAKVPEGEEVVFTIRFKDIYGIEEAENYYLVEIYSSVLEENIDKLVRNQKLEINGSVLDENNNLRNRSLGLLEMEASAAFLRQIELTDIESDNYIVDDNNSLFHKEGDELYLNLLKPFAVNRHLCVTTDSDGKPVTSYSGKLGYRFFIQKPKDFLFVGKWTLFENEKEDKAAKNRLINLGIQFIPRDDFLSKLKRNTIFPHSFVILDTIENLQSFKTLLSLRQIIVSDEETKNNLLSLLKNEDRDHLEDQIWGLYAKTKSWLSGDLAIVANVYDSLNNNAVIITNHPEMKGFVRNLQFRENKDCEFWIEGLPSLREGKLPKFGKYSVQGDGRFPQTRYRNNIKSQPAVKQEIFEAYHYPVIIIDERVQRFAEENKESEVPCWALHYTTNVFIPRRPGKDKDGRIIDPPVLEGIPQKKEDTIPLDPEEFTSEITNNLVDYIQRHLDNHPGASLLIHYGILERMFNGVHADIKGHLIRWAEQAHRVVVTSGRGAHSIDLPDSVCFVNLSSVLYACNECRNKYIIYSLINQSRRKKS